MAPKAAEKKPTTGGKAPAGKAPAAEKKEAGKKTAAAPSGEKKKRGKTRKETYSSYIYKGEPYPTPSARRHRRVAFFRLQLKPNHLEAKLTRLLQSSSKSTQTLVSPTVPCPS
jgi:hypothetical protein